MSFGILFFFLAIYLEMQKWHFDWKKKIKKEVIIVAFFELTGYALQIVLGKASPKIWWIFQYLKQI